MLNSTANGQPWRDTVVSIVRNARETETTDISLDAALENIRNGRWAKPVAKIRERYVEAFKQAEKDGVADPHRAAKDAIAPLKLKLQGSPSAVASKFARATNSIPTRALFVRISIRRRLRIASALSSNSRVDAHVQAAFRFAIQLRAESAFCNPARRRQARSKLPGCRTSYRERLRPRDRGRPSQRACTALLRVERSEYLHPTGPRASSRAPRTRMPRTGTQRRQAHADHQGPRAGDQHEPLSSP